MHLMDGLTDKEIAEKEVVELSTVKSHVNNIYKYFGVHTRTKLIVTIFKQMWKEREDAIIKQISTENEVL